jgi:flagellar hook-associated protein 2
MASIISGLGAGIDMQAIVTQLMQVERAPEAKMNTLRLGALAAQSAWADLGSKLGALKTAAKALHTTTDVQSSTATSSDTSVLTATAGLGAQLGSVGIKVLGLASAQQLSSGALSAPSMLVGAGQAVVSAGVGTIGGSAVAVTGATTDGAHRITVTQASSKAVVAGTAAPALSFGTGTDDLTVTLADGVPHAITLAGSYATAADLVTDLNTKLAGAAQVNLVAGQLQVSSRDEGSGATLTLSGGALGGLGLSGTTATGTDALVSLDGGAATTVSHLDGSTAIDLGSGVTLTSSGHLGLGSASLDVVRTTSTSTLSDLTSALNASGSPVTASLVNTGDGSATPYRLVLSATGTGSAGALTIDSSGINVLGAGQLSTVVTAADAQLEVGGATITRSTNTVTDLVPGVTINLVKATPSGGSPTTVSVSRDPAATATKVQALVDAVNGVLNAVKTQTAYAASTNKGGPLSGEGGARAITSTLLDAVLSATGTGQTKVLSQLGIQTSRDGTLTFDSTAFSAAVTKDSDGVASLVAGFAKGLEDYTTQATGTDGVVTLGGKSAGAEARRRQDQIDAFEVRMAALQTSYSARFAALDAALGKLKQQQSALMSAIGGLGTGA